MIPVDEALNRILGSARILGDETVSLDNSLARIIAQDVSSDMDIPPFNKSAMDGFAYNSNDKNTSFTIIENIPAGKIPKKAIHQGECAKIMTGAVVPEGADKVIRVENTREQNGVMSIAKPEKALNICYKGEDIKQGKNVLLKGTPVSPQVIGILATTGHSNVRVYKKPVVGIIATGNEIVEPHEKPFNGKIRNSNSYQLSGQISRCGGKALYLGIARDTEEQIDEIFREALESSDIVILSGGVSMGDYDFVPGVLKKNGVNILFEEVAVKPGRPTVFGLVDRTYIFGLPGNPVSTFVIFEVLVKPLICRLSGYEFKSEIRCGTAAQDIHAKRSKRVKFLPAVMDKDNNVTVPEYHGSAHLNAYINATGILRIEAGTNGYCKGETVYVRQL